jgi:hypothetical protein
MNADMVRLTVLETETPGVEQKTPKFALHKEEFLRIFMRPLVAF